MAWIDKNLENFISERFPTRKVYAYCEYRTWQSSRYLWVTTYLSDETDIHYEYIGGKVELHIEGKFQSNDYKYFARELRVKTARFSNLTWSQWQGHSQCRCTINYPTDSWEDLYCAFKEIMAIFDPLIEEISASRNIQRDNDAYEGDTQFEESDLSGYNVSLESCSLGKLYGNKLIIPEYQRTYCWEEKQVKDLWHSLKEVPLDGKYHLGTVILQKTKDGEYAVIDGQQRLVTLTLVLSELGYKGCMPLLTQTFR